MFTMEELDASLPTTLKGKMGQEIANTLNSVITDPMIAQNFRDNFISYTKVLKEGRFKVEDYVNAVLYVSFKLMGYSDKECYQKTFPDKYQALVQRGTSAKDIASYVSAYNRGQLVNKVLEQTIIPSYVLNQDIYQQAINVSADLMMNAKSEMVRQKAADSILNHLKRPEESKVKISVGIEDTSELVDLKKQMAELAEMQRNAIGSGVSTKTIAHQRLVDVTPEENR